MSGLTCTCLISYADWLYNKTFMDFSAGVHDVICTRKIVFQVHITSFIPAEKSIML